MTTTRDSAPILPVTLLLCWMVITMLLWGMAFYQAPEATPEWLLRAQSACFGTSETGLPDTYGWMVLALGPLSFLAGLVVAMGHEVRQGVTAMLSSRGGQALALVALSSLLIEGMWVKGRIEAGIDVASATYSFETPGELPLDYPRLNTKAASFTLTDQHGAQISPESMGSGAVFLTFAFAHCKTVCPVILTNVLQAADEFSVDEVKILVVTLDPWRDTPRALPTLAEHWGLGANAHVLSGPVDDVLATLDAYNVPRQRDEKTGDVTHPALVYLLDGEGEIAYAFNNPNVGWLKTAVNRVIKPASLAADHRR
ncbi:MAG: SCO family protein [Gemmatimonadetes bacterium]|jgi:cytochrome oxidase Cu insertion factor (SCO1/SenC/PrrC family)|nr:SCO family protein [Gemmatimonadota bacterium]MBT4612853.1 SCO family protein [Gemmatimonadota bacterium]MBT5057565.1 SCO family protein [Gemmatimonadota bacterium]MBT5142700.1 SCO family protein [Gemmatimonadota bacterium]MBT5587676.1 SCO family protein [Gemmatimonadota bacterium]